MSKLRLIATTQFGLEAVVKRELIALGYENITITPGRIEFDATVADIPRVNMWLRTADRIRLKIGAFEALTFDSLFEQTKALPWEDWITKDGEFTVTGKSVKSDLMSVRSSQSIVKKAVVERLKSAYKVDWLNETDEQYTIEVALLNNVATLTIDTSGSGLHKRGYRAASGGAPLRETLAAALVQLSYWYPDRYLLDPMCGSGTILIEAAMLAKNIAPGLKRRFASEDWPIIGGDVWKEVRQHAREAQKPFPEPMIFGSDNDESVIKIAKENAIKAGVDDSIQFETKPMDQVWVDRQFGVVITNPPYGKRMAEFQEINKLYITFHKMFRKKKGWSIYVITSDRKFPDYFKRARPDRVRKLYNGPIEANYYQYYGDRPPRDA